jgi:Ca2+-transporting ATPase
VVHGQGIALVKATGARSEIGRIGKALQTVHQEETTLQRETRSVVKTVFLFAIILFVIVVIIYGITRGDWLEGLLTGLTLAMAMLPEEFPVVLTIFLALGAWRISQKQVLTRKMAAVETLGAATVLCVDKTGTLTQNRMRIQTLHAAGKFFEPSDQQSAPLPEEFHELLEYGILASQVDPFDPMEKAIHEVGSRTLTDTEHVHNNWTLVQQYPLSRQLLALSHVWRHADARDYTVATKGAPEAIADLCHLDQGQTTTLMVDVYTMAEKGLRVLGVAKARFSEENLPDAQHDFHFDFIGLLGLEDPIRPSVPPAIAECCEAGIKVVMITGDYPGTAQNIARQIGLPNPENLITGPELDRMSTDELAGKIGGISIFARVVPEQKLLIVDALKKNGEVTAMTGDGVNDAPALKSAHIGVAMGARGTDVAREASDLVLLDDDFSSIVAAVRLGRRIFDNLKKAMAYIISVHIPIALVSLVPVILQWKEMILYPVHIVFLELIIDPACSVVFEEEPEDRGIMKRKPRSPKERLFSRKSLVVSFLQGIMAFAAVIAMYRVSLSLGQSFAEARSLAFITLIISNLCMILVNRSWTHNIFVSLSVTNHALRWVLLGAVAFLALVVYAPGLRSLFHFAPMHFIDIVLSLGTGIVSVAWFEIVKIISARRVKK